jgi:hypothetical protein
MVHRLNLGAAADHVASSAPSSIDRDRPLRRGNRVPQVSDGKQREAKDSTQEIEIVARAIGQSPLHPRD